MSAPLDTVRTFYDRLAAGDTPGALALLTPDIEWQVVAGWPYRPVRRGPQAVADGVLLPLLGEWDAFGVELAELLPVGDVQALALGRYVGRHKTSGAPLSVQLAHLWDVTEGRLTRFRGHADTLALARARGG